MSISNIVEVDGKSIRVPSVRESIGLTQTDLNVAFAEFNDLYEYRIERPNHRGPVAVAEYMEGYNRAKKDKEENPALEFGVVELVVRGSVRASLMWRDGRWC